MKKYFIFLIFISLICILMVSTLFSQSKNNPAADEVLKELGTHYDPKEIEKENVERKYKGKAPQTFSSTVEEMSTKQEERVTKKKKTEIIYSFPEKMNLPEYSALFGQSLKEEKQVEKEKDIKEIIQGLKNESNLNTDKYFLSRWVGKYYCSVDENIEVSLVPITRSFKCLRYINGSVKEQVKNVMIQFEPTVPYLTSLEERQNVIPQLKGKVVEIGGRSFKKENAIPVYSFEYKTGEIRDDLADEIDERLARYIIANSLASAGAKTSESVSQIFQNAANQGSMYYYYVGNETNKGNEIKESLKQVPQAGLYYFLSGIAENTGKAMSRNYKLAPIFKVNRGKIFYFKIEE